MYLQLQLLWRRTYSRGMREIELLLLTTVGARSDALGTCAHSNYSCRSARALHASCKRRR